MNPPFVLTSKINNLIAEISKLLGLLEAITLQVPNPKLRRKNQIRTIKSTLAIEGHHFSEDQITAVLEKKKILGAKKEILEVQNAIELYESIHNLQSTKLKDLLKGHNILMSGLIASAGKFRSKNVGILAGTKVKHLAPKPRNVPELMGHLFKWLKSERDIHPLIRSSIAHYEIEFIHPFEDGNGRIGRFWQALILKEYDEFFMYVPIESLIEKHQVEYYNALEKSDQSGESTFFVEFMLTIIKASLNEMASELVNVTQTQETRLKRAKKQFKNKSFTRKDYLNLFKNISSATASRDLKQALLEKILTKTGEKNQTRYQFP